MCPHVYLFLPIGFRGHSRVPEFWHRDQATPNAETWFLFGDCFGKVSAGETFAYLLPQPVIRRISGRMFRPKPCSPQERLVKSPPEARTFRNPFRAGGDHGTELRPKEQTCALGLPHRH